MYFAVLLITNGIIIIIIIIIIMSMVQNIALRFWKMLAYMCQTEMLETLVSLILTLSVKTALLFDALRRQMSMTVILIYIMDVQSWLMIGYYLKLLLPNIEIFSRSKCYENHMLTMVWKKLDNLK